jgi:glycosyltransferase involved in cell wall biosynthesis
VSDPPSTVHFLVPEGLADPARPSGGNHYGLRLADELGRLGREVRLVHRTEHLATGSLVLVDGLVADRAVADARRLRVVLLLHVPDAGPLVAAARAVVTTSAWTAERLGRPAYVARPGVDPAPLATVTRAGGRLLCVAAVVRAKGHDVLLEALAEVDDLDWEATCVGPLDREPAWVASLRPSARAHFTGARVGEELAAAYSRSDLLVLPTRQESYGMVVAEAQARGIPVLASDVGGVSEALDDGGGVLVAPDDPGALADALRRWLEDSALRDRLRARSRARRTALTGWEVTARAVAGALEQAS